MAFYSSTGLLVVNIQPLKFIGTHTYMLIPAEVLMPLVLTNRFCLIHDCPTGDQSNNLWVDQKLDFCAQAPRRSPPASWLRLFILPTWTHSLCSSSYFLLSFNTLRMKQHQKLFLKQLSYKTDKLILIKTTRTICFCVFTTSA